MTLDVLARRLILPGSPFELVQMGADTDGVRRFRQAPQSLNGIYRKSSSSAQHTCLYFDGLRVRYAVVLGEASALANELTARHGVRAGTRIGLLLPDSPAWLSAFIGVTSAGAVAVLIDARAPTETAIAQLDATNCALVITSHEFAAQLQDLGDRRPRIIALAGNEPARAFFVGVVHSDAALPFYGAIDPEQEALVAFTSGSTGRPKAARSTHRAVIAGLMNMMLGGALASRRQPVRQAPPSLAPPASLLLSPFAHVAGYSHLLLMMQIAGAVAPLVSWNKTAALDLIERERLTTVSGVNPEILRDLLQSDAREHDLASLTSAAVHGVALRPGLLAQIGRRLPNARVATGYGLTETNGAICSAVGADLEAFPGTCGPIVPSVDARICDERGQYVPLGSIGELCVKGAMLMTGYCEPADNVASMWDGGWFRTGDFGHLDREGFLYLSERRQDVLVLGDLQVSCAALERIVCECERIDDAAAIVVTDAGGTRRLMLAVVSADEEKTQKHRIIARLAREEAFAASPFEIVSLPRLPRTASGKVDRRALSEQLTRSQASDASSA